MAQEHVVLIDEDNNVLGSLPKSEVHQAKTPLHRAFSAFIFNQDKKLLLQQRSHKKKTWPLMWSNSCCGHPALNESNQQATLRRLKDELALSVNDLQEVAPYRYTFSKDGVMENEICPILIGTTNDQPQINTDEVEIIEWIKWQDFLNEIKNNPDKYSPWCIEQAAILKNNQSLKDLLNT